MRKTAIISTVLCAVLMTLSLSSQAQQTRWSKGLKAKYTHLLSGYNIIGHDENVVYAYPKMNVLKLMKLNPSTMAMTEATYTLKGAEGNRDLEFIVMLKDELYLFSSVQDKKRKKHVLYVQTVNKSTLRPNTSLKKVVELDYAGESNRRPALFFYDISPDKSKLLVAYV
ncbi:MAG: hypothetical protein LBH82_00235, partial [Bacteroidales bacterium]|nr:hypothetical protein [Bacteroidales bacterium]